MSKGAGMTANCKVDINAASAEELDQVTELRGTGLRSCDTETSEAASPISDRLMKFRSCAARCPQILPSSLSVSELTAPSLDRAPR